MKKPKIPKVIIPKEHGWMTEYKRLFPRITWEPNYSFLKTPDRVWTQNNYLTMIATYPQRTGAIAKNYMTKFAFDPVKHVYTLDGKPLMGVTSVLGVISKPNLIQWAANMACEYIKEYCGSDYSQILNDQVVEQARYAHKRNKEEAADAGTDVHALAERYVLDCIAKNGGNAMQTTTHSSIQKFVDWAVSNNIRFIAAERQFYSEKMWLAGTCDLIFEKDGKTYIGDIKTYKKIWDRTPFLQCAGYSLMAEETDNLSFNGYCILRMKNGEFEEKWSFDVEGDREAFLAALTLYKALKEYQK